MQKKKTSCVEVKFPLQLFSFGIVSSCILIILDLHETYGLLLSFIVFPNNFIVYNQL